MKIAIVADWLTNYGGAEQVVSAFHELFPTAPIYTTLFGQDEKGWYKSAQSEKAHEKRSPPVRRRHNLSASQQQWQSSLFIKKFTINRLQNPAKICTLKIF